MRTLLCALAGIALLRAPGADVGPTSLEPSVLQESQVLTKKTKAPCSYKTCLPTAAEPFVPSRGDPARSTGCDTHMAVHGRLDVIEEKVEKTVEHLEAEVKGLLSQLEELAWNLPQGPFSPTPDLLGDDHF